ncbi:MAG: MFS transporter, partial [spirochete symbiont of Stewartia floridana]
GKEGHSLGFMRGLTNLGKVVGTILVSAIFLIPRVQADRDGGGRMGYTTTYIAILVFLGLAAVIALGMARSTEPLERKRVYFHRKFNKYYILEIFYGGRKQVFLTFAPYLLILRYGTDVEYLAGLLGICASINILINPLIGRMIDKIGYRNVMISDTVILFFVCLIYGFAHRIFNEQTALFIISVTFILDRMISNASIASSVYAGRISGSKEEMTSTLTTGLSVNHLVTILIALAGGFIWEKMGVEYLFSLAALMAAANSLFACTVSKE